MASASEENEFFFERIQSFPAVVNGQIDLEKFLDASVDLIAIIERFGTVFTPVKYDMQGNIDKIKKYHKLDDNSCLLELMIEESNAGKLIVTEGVLWLNRALLFFELMFDEILRQLKCEENHNDVNMKQIYAFAYEGSVKKYHNWVTQQLFNVICKMSPTLQQMMKSLGVQDVVQFETILTNYNITLHIVRSKIDDFFKDNNLFNERT